MSTYVTKGRIISFGTTIRIQSDSLERWGWVLFSADREKYIEFCKRETIRPYWDMVSPCLRNNSQLSIRNRQTDVADSAWDPPQMVKPKRPGIDKEEPMYAYKLKQEADALLYKFTSSKFKTYFVMSTNCVLLADTIVGTAGTDILSARGFISPGRIKIT